LQTQLIEQSLIAILVAVIHSFEKNGELLYDYQKSRIKPPKELVF